MRIDNRALDQTEFGAMRHQLREVAQPKGKPAWTAYAALARGYPRAYDTGGVDVPHGDSGYAKVRVSLSNIAVMLVRHDDTIARDVRDGGVLAVSWDDTVWAITDREVFGRRKWLKLTLVSENIMPESFDRTDRERIQLPDDKARP